VLLALAGTALLAVPVASVASEVEPPRPEAPPTTVSPGAGGPASLGRELYVRSCASCHGTNAEGTPRGPSVVGVGAASAYFQLTTGRMPPSDLDEIPSRSEPAYDDEEIAALVDYIGSLGDGPPVPEVGPGEADDGLLLYVENCAACHSATGVGAAKVTRVRSPSLMSSTPTQIGSAVRVGPNLMPHYPEEVLDEQDVDDLVAYVQHLQTTGDRGGLSLGRIGPTTETLAGWAALGLLLLVVRRLGRTA
jgi:ubiquinol-cytochrome c reductase cytochrome c subunit